MCLCMYVTKYVVYVYAAYICVYTCAYVLVCGGWEGDCSYLISAATAVPIVVGLFEQLNRSTGR